MVLRVCFSAGFWDWGYIHRWPVYITFGQIFMLFSEQTHSRLHSCSFSIDSFVEPFSRISTWCSYILHGQIFRSLDVWGAYSCTSLNIGSCSWLFFLLAGCALVLSLTPSYFSYPPPLPRTVLIGCGRKGKTWGSFHWQIYFERFCSFGRGIE